MNRETAIIDGIANLLMAHESWRLALPGRRTKDINERRKRMDHAAREFLRVALLREPTDLEIEQAVSG